MAAQTWSTSAWIQASSDCLPRMAWCPKIAPAIISVTISGPRSVFERELGPLGDEQELPIDRLPPAVARAVQAVTFGPPADYGPPAP